MLDLDLVALATVADVVPLVGENRSLVKRGLAEMRRAQRPGMRALMAAAKCEPTRLDEGDLAFRLAPRINAAGRLYRADAGVELLLTEDEARAEEIADELSRANSRAAGDRARGRHGRRGGAAGAAGGAARSAGAGRRRRGLASRRGRDRRLAAGRAPPPAGGRHLARRRGRRARLGAQHPRLRPARRRSRPAPSTWSSFGGHRAAAGLAAARPRTSTPSARPSPPTRPSVLGPEDLRRTERIDAMVGGARPRPRSGRGAAAAGAVRDGQSRACGCWSPRPGSATCGRWGRASTPASASTAAPTGRSASPSAAPASGSSEDDPVDAAVRLEVNHWNGSVEPRVVLRELYPREAPRRSRAHACECGRAEWWQRFEAELARDPGATGRRRSRSERPAAVAGGSARRDRRAGLQRRRRARGLRRASRCALRRRQRARPLQRRRRIACALRRAAMAARAAAAWLADYADARTRSPELAARFEHVVLVDPPRLGRPASAVASRSRRAGGFLHRALERGRAALRARVARRAAGPARRR